MQNAVTLVPALVGCGRLLAEKENGFQTGHRPFLECSMK